jgi:hypothetical protein
LIENIIGFNIKSACSFPRQRPFCAAFLAVPLTESRTALAVDLLALIPEMTHLLAHLCQETPEFSNLFWE